MPDDSFEIEFGALQGRIVVGLDEAGRGPWAGPVMAAAVVLDLRRLPRSLRNGLDDSKRLSLQRREEMAAALADYALAAVGEATAAEVDRINVLQASFLAMRRAIEALGVVPHVALVDGNRPPPLDCPPHCVVGGDGISLSIAAASILAKVARDRHMEVLAERFPGYGWERNRGYGTPEHEAGLHRMGPSDEHRLTFRPLRERFFPTY